MFNIDTSYRAKHYGGKNTPKYIVVHYTANGGITATAKSNANYFSSTYREASAHYVVDEGDTVYCCVPPSNAAYAVGDIGKGRLKGIVTNYNSISIEMVSHSNAQGYYIPEKTIENTAELIKQLMSRYGIPINNIIRHYDVTGKLCPEPYIDNAKWEQFIKKIERGNDEMTEQERKQFGELQTRVKILEEQNIVYNWTEACPKWSQPYVQKALDLGWIKGDENGFLRLTDDTIRIIVIMLRKEGIMQ